jgi:hypothetical protein
VYYENRGRDTTAGQSGDVQGREIDIILLQEFPNAPGEGILAPEQVRLYAQGWGLAEDSPNWTRYCFYGGDIRREALASLLAQVCVLAQALQDGQRTCSS